ncbi:MAG: hypothetical protein EOO41_01870, partial [Methanobacteriota archaeon]
MCRCLRVVLGALLHWCEDARFPASWHALVPVWVVIARCIRLCAWPQSSDDERTATQMDIIPRKRAVLSPPRAPVPAQRRMHQLAAGGAAAAHDVASGGAACTPHLCVQVAVRTQRCPAPPKTQATLEQCWAPSTATSDANSEVLAVDAGAPQPPPVSSILVVAVVYYSPDDGDTVRTHLHMSTQLMLTHALGTVPSAQQISVVRIALPPRCHRVDVSLLAVDRNSRVARLLYTPAHGMSAADAGQTIWTGMAQQLDLWMPLECPAVCKRGSNSGCGSDSGRSRHRTSRAAATQGAASYSRADANATARHAEAASASTTEGAEIEDEAAAVQHTDVDAAALAASARTPTPLLSRHVQLSAQLVMHTLPAGSHTLNTLACALDEAEELAQSTTNCSSGGSLLLTPAPIPAHIPSGFEDNEAALCVRDAILARRNQTLLANTSLARGAAQRGSSSMRDLVPLLPPGAGTDDTTSISTATAAAAAAAT